MTDTLHPLAEKMAERGISQRSLAATLGVAQSTLSRLLAGQAEPSLRIVLATMEALGASSPDDLFTPSTITQRVRFWATPDRVPRREAMRRTVVERVLAGGPLP